MDKLFITPQEVEHMLRQHAKKCGVNGGFVGVQIIVEQPFAEGMTAHNEVPGFNLIFRHPDRPTGSNA